MSISNSIDTNSISTEISLKSDFDSKITELTLKNYEEDKENSHISCPHCQKKIVFKKQYIKRIRGINIKCQYCFNYMFATSCPKCKKFDLLPKFNDICEIITCTCKNQYLQSACVILNCPDIINFLPPRNTNLPNGFIFNHRSELVFQKISCYYCHRPIDYITRAADKINRYYEGTRVNCVYSDCRKKFNRLVCPKCSEVIIVQLGMYIMGTKIKCQKCNFIFAKILCVECLKINPMEKSSFKYGEFQCRFASCNKLSHLAICAFCQRINSFKLNKEQSLIQGQCIECGYKDCGKKFSCVSCMGCHNLNYFTEEKFIFGKLYRCKYKAICSKSFMVLVCPKCWTYSRVLEESEGKKYNCAKCGTLLSNFGCPHCNNSLLDMDSSYNKGQVIICPLCDKKFSFCRCYSCKKLIYYKKDKSILGKLVKCECGETSVNIICQKCRVRISIEGRENDIENGEKINCPSCKEDFEYTSNDNDEEILYKKKLITMENGIGIPVDFGVPEIDENFLETEKFLIYPKLSGNNSISQNETTANSIVNIEEEKEKEIKVFKGKLCILCQCEEKESIFYPCGHRHTCYKCAVNFFEVFKKCPRCNKPAQAIIKKIYK